MKPADTSISTRTSAAADIENSASLPHSPVSVGRGVSELCGSNESRLHVTANPPERDTRTLDLFEDQQ
ncbi:hypothetical protein AEMCBJ_34585 (plasmid) [Cupriavidus necator]|uniref:hypothetical protein n=1 Tax=Cupriavidus necator TaxID=106590 RepID=UPI003F741D89